MKTSILKYLTGLIVAFLVFGIFHPVIMTQFFIDFLPPISDKETNIHIQTFYSELKKRRINPLSVKIVSAPENYLDFIFGPNQDSCQILGSQRYVILTSNPSERTVFHELGHCVLFRGHRFDLFDSGMPTSWMHQASNDLAENYMSNPVNREYYLNELFYAPYFYSVFDESHGEYFFFPIKTITKQYTMWQRGTASILEPLSLILIIFISYIMILIIAYLIINMLWYSFTSRSKNYHD